MVHGFYLSVKKHDVWYNGAIVDLYDRSVVASITDMVLHHIS